MRKKKYLVCGLILIAVLAVLAAMFILRETKGTVTIINQTSKEITGGNLEVCRKRFELLKLKSGESQNISFKIKSDSHYQISVQFASGETLNKNLGYVTHGMETKDTLLIQDNDIVLIDSGT